MAHPASPRIRAFTRALLASTALVGVGLGLVPLRPVPVRAEPLPTGGQVVSGGVTIGAPSGHALAITQSSQTAIVNWQGFSVGPGHRVDIRQPNASAAILNRVTGATPSTIAGQLNANGQVYLVNPNGVTITRTGQVNAAGFVASSLGISDEDFKAGRRQFRGAGASAKVANHGSITIGRGGYAALIGGQVANTGTISVPMGRVGLGSGERATLDLSGDGFLQVAVPTGAKGRGALVRHSGTISADGGSVTLTAAAARDMARQAVNLSGVVEARSVSGRSGSITLSGDEGGVRVAPGARLDASGLDGADGGRVRISGGRLDVAGTVDVSGARGGRARLKAGESLALSGRVGAEGSAGRGGRVVATAPTIAAHAALIEASGASGGGVVRVGGGRLGQGPLARAERVTVDAATTIRADATARGNGGDVVVWSDVATRFSGTITARGGASGGNGGQAEVSSKGVLSYDGTTLLTAARGAFGTLLLDPYDITISNGADRATTNNAGTFTAGANDSVLGVATLESALANGNVTVSTGAAVSAGTQAGTITVASPLTWSSGSRLTLTAASAISVNAPITVAGGGQFTLNTGTETVGSSTQPLLSFGQGASVTFASGQSGQALTINGQGYTLVRDMVGLAWLDGQSGAYALATNLDAAGPTYGAAVIGSFSGRLEGLGHTIANLTITSANPNPNIGLIGRLNAGGTVRDLGMVGASVTGNVGVTDVRAGGLVGNNSGTVSQSYATGSVTASASDSRSIVYAGGLVGYNDGTVSRSYAIGSVTTSAGDVVATGGLVGRTDAMVTQSYAASSVATNGGRTYRDVGGLVGVVGSGPNSNGTVSQSYATGSVTINGSGAGAGGLVGLNYFPSTYIQSYWDTQTSGVSSSGSSSIGQGLTTAQLQSGTLPAGFDPAVWATGSGLYPYLRSFFPGGVQAVSGTAYSDAGMALASTAGRSYAVSVVTDGTARGTVFTGANGYYYVPVPAGTLPAGSTVLAYSAPVTAGSLDTPVGAVLATTSGSVATAPLNIAGGAFNGSTGATRYSALGIPNAVVAALPTGLTTTGAGFTLDQPLTTSRAFSVGTVPGAGLTVAAPITVASGGSLGLLSGGTLRVNAPVQVRGGATAALAYDGTGPTNLSFAQGTGLTFLNADGSAAETAVAGQSLSINGQGYTLIRSMQDLDGIDGVAAVAGGAINPQAGGLSGRYALVRDLAATGTIYTNALVGTGSSGDSRTQFSGTFEGLGHTVTGLTIAKSGDYAGLFGFVASGGTVRDLGLVGGSVRGRNYVGGLVGSNSGSVSQAYATGSVRGTRTDVGGLVGYNNDGRISQAYATGSVRGSGFVGGLVGWNSGSISQAYATGSVGGTDGGVGGLVGYNNFGSISQAYATGRVGGSSEVGGLVGYNSRGRITAGAWDIQTSGTAIGLGRDENNQAGNVADRTTAALQGNLPAGFDPAAWATGPGLYPYLESVFPNGVQAISGTAYADRGLTPLASSGTSPAHVTLAIAGTQRQVTTGANGAYYLARPAGTLASTGTATLAYTTADGTPAGSVTGASLTDATGTTRNLDVWGNTLIAPTIATTLSTAPATVAALLTPANRSLLAAAQGGTGLGDPAGLTGVGYVATAAAGFTLDAGLGSGAAGGLYLRSTQGPVRVARAQTLSGAGLTLLSAGSLVFEAGVTARGAAAVTLGYDAANPANLSFAAGRSLTFANADGSTAIAPVSGQALTINGQGYTLIRTMADLDGIDGVAAVAGGAINPQADGLSGRYALAADLPESSTIYTNALVGTNSSGDSRTQFSGTFEGLGHTVTGLTIAKSGDYAGLFGFVASGGTVRDLGLVGGGVRGRNYVGGLVGYNDGTISQAYATGSVSGDISVGGLVGENAGGGRISQAYATGSVSATNTFVGGLTGYNDGIISQAYATGSVSGDSVGGLVGSNYGGRISQAYATGRVSGTGSLGGLVGNNQFGTITASAWDSQTSGTATGLGVDSNSQAGNVAGLTTPQLQGLDPLPGGGTFSTLTALGDGTTSAFSGGAGGLYPYLTSFFPTGVQAITGTAQTAAGTALAGAQVGFYADGRLLGGGTVSSGANGYVYHAVAAGTLGAGTVRIGASLTPAGGIDATGLFYTDSAALTGRTLALGPIIAGQNRQSTAQVTFGGLRADLAATFGADRFAALSTALAATPLEITATGAGFILDQSLNASGSVRLATTDADATLTLAADLNLGTDRLTLAAAGAIDQSAGAITAGWLTGSSGGDARLARAGNALGTLAGFAAGGSLTLATGSSLTLASGTQVTAAGDVALSTTGAFVNDAGRGAVASRAGRWLIYAANSAGNTFGGLDSGHTAVWGTAAGATVAVPGNRYVFAERPTLTVTATDLTKTYGEDATGRVAGAYTLTGLRPGLAGAYLGDTAGTALSGTPRVTSPGSGAGAAVADSPYAITADLTGLTSPAGYALALGDAGRLTVTPAPVIVTARSGSSTYGDTPVDPGLSASGLVGGEGIGLLTGLSSGFGLDAASAAGRYTLAVTGSLTNRNYRIDRIEAGTFTVDPRALTVTADALTRRYGDANPALTYTVGGRGLVNGDRLVGTLATGAAVTSAVGDYAITQGSLAASANYRLTYQGADLTVTARPVTLSGTRVYDATTGIAGGLLTIANRIDGDSVSVSGTGTLAGRNAGTQTLADLSGLRLSNPNYTLADAGGTVTITQALLTARGAQGIDKTYDGTPALPAGRRLVELAGILGTDAGGVGLDSIALGYDSGDAGPRTIAVSGLRLTGAEAGNYRLSATSVIAAGTIIPASITVTALGGRSVYGETLTNPGLSATGLVGGQDESVLTGLSNSFDLDHRSAAGRYTLTVAGTLTNGNYTVAAREAGTWTVTPRTLVVIPDALTRAYGDATPARGGASGDGLVNSDRIGDVGLLTPASAASGVGRYALSATDARFAAGEASNYALTYATRGDGLIVLPRAVTVTAQAQTRTYGDGNPALTYTIGGRGLADGDGLSGRLATDATAGSGVGTYAIVQGTLAASANYAVTYQRADLTVTPRPVSLSGTRVYDGTAGIAGGLLTAGNLRNGDTVTIVGSGILAGRNVGSRSPRDATGLYLSNPNYTLTGASGTVAITPATLTYTADPASRTYGAADPALTGTVSGFVPGESLASATTGTLAFTTPAGAGSNVGRYAVTGSGLTANNGNYVLVQAAGNAAALTVDPAGLTVTGARTYDAATGFRVGQLTVSGGANGETLMLTAGSGATASADAGRYAGASLTDLSLSVAGGNGSVANYALPSAGTLTITPASVTVTANGDRSVYGDTPTNPGLSATGLVGGQDASVLTGLSSSFGLDATSAAGDYGLTVTGRLTNGNYRLGAVEAGTYTIDRRPLTVTADALTRPYGDANPALTYSLGGRGLANGDRLSGALVTAANAGSGVGAYAIGQGTLTASANYTVSYQGAALTVTARPIVVVADPQARLAGAGNPPLTYRVGGRGLVAGDRLTGALATAADADSAPGVYAIAQGSLSASANYRLGFVGADLTVLPVPAQPQPKPRPVAIDPAGLASTAERAARLDARPVDPALPLLLGSSPGGVLRVSDPRFEAPLVCTGQQGGCFLGPSVILTAPKPQAGLSATAR